MTEEDFGVFQRAAESVLLYGPDSDLPGVRADGNLASKRHAPDTTLCVALNYGEKALKLSLSTLPIGGNNTWRTWDLVREDIQKTWPKLMPIITQDWTETTDLDSDTDRVFSYKIGIRNQPGHFIGDWSFFTDAAVTLLELSFTDFGYPCVEFRKQSRDEEQWPKLHHCPPSHIRARNEILGRSWYRTSPRRVRES